MADNVDQVMQSIPAAWRGRWCEAEVCACMGCVQIGNRKIMYRAMMGKPFVGDPEYINEQQISQEVWDEYKVTREEWEVWKSDDR